MIAMNLNTKVAEIRVGHAEPEVTDYKCANCGAEDCDHGTNGVAPIALNCYRCGAGRGLDLASMIQRRAGMFPVQKEKGR